MGLSVPGRSVFLFVGQTFLSATLQGWQTGMSAPRRARNVNAVSWVAAPGSVPGHLELQLARRVVGRARHRQQVAALQPRVPEERPVAARQVGAQLRRLAR